MGLLMTFAVTAQTASAGFLPRPPLEHEYLRLVAATRHVFRTGTMTALATLLCGATCFIQGGLPMRRLRPSVVNFLVTGFAGLRSHVLGTICGRGTGRGRTGGLSVLRRNLLAILTVNEGDGREEIQYREKKRSRGPAVCRH